MDSSSPACSQHLNAWKAASTFLNRLLNSGHLGARSSKSFEPEMSNPALRKCDLSSTCVSNGPDGKAMTATSSAGALGSGMRAGFGSTHSSWDGTSISLLPPGLAADAPRSLSEPYCAGLFSSAASTFAPLVAKIPELTLGMGKASGEGGNTAEPPASAGGPSGATASCVACVGSIPWLSAKWTSAGDGDEARRFASADCCSSDNGLSASLPDVACDSGAVPVAVLATSAGSVTDLGAIGCTSSLSAPSLIKASRRASVSHGCCLKASAFIRLPGFFARRPSRRFGKSVDLCSMSRLAFGSRTCADTSTAALEDNQVYHGSKGSLKLASVSGLLSLSSAFACCWSWT
mmetsp:Transcript_35224/g.64344  ORF Transcript_35224/g.64344 Transcript_35224/m.64344 type:complete len:347 (+) Transcript_35224:1378-2418(+)